MQFTTLGYNSLQVPVIGQGCMGIGGGLSRRSDEDDAQIKALELGIDLGMTLIDTAEVYGAGHSEELVGKAIHGKRAKVTISTKFSPENNGYDNLIKSCEDSLKRLRTDHIDLYQIHWPNPVIPIEETMRGLEQLLDDGKICAIGVSNFSVRELREAQDSLGHNRIVSNQVEFNLFDRFIEKSVLSYCLNEKVSIIAYSPLDKGRVSDSTEKAIRLQEIAEKYERTSSQVALNWLIRQSSGIVIPKAITTAHIQQNSEASDFTLSDEDHDSINKIFAPEPDMIATSQISVSPEGEDNRSVYTSLEQAIENPLEFIPSPLELAEFIKKGEPVKPVRLIKQKNTSGTVAFELIEGRIRYWAWVIAHGWGKAIPAYVRKNGG